MEKGRLRTPGLLAWASGRAAEGLLWCCCVQARLADHPETCAKGTMQTRQRPAKPHLGDTGDRLGPQSVAATGGLPFIFWEVIPISLQLPVPVLPEPLLRAEG